MNLTERFDMLPDIKELTKDQLISWLEGRNIKPYRAKQILMWIYMRQADTFEVMTDVGKDIRKCLARHFSIKRLERERTETSQDGSKKFLFKLIDGKYVESVLIPEKNHFTLCISSQVGCAQGCRFCLTGRGGLVRNLTKGEIIAQVRDVANGLDDSKRLTNIVMMGMGEPLHNLDNVVAALHILYASTGFDYGPRKVTLSTSGLVPEMCELGRRIKVNLAVSLNATTDDVRDQLMPVNRRYPIKALMEACRTFPLAPRQRITFEYILIQGVNDSQADARRLVKLLHGIKAKVNLIPFNEHAGSEYRKPTDAAMRAFQTYLLDRQIVAVRRAGKGQDISAACGQLKGKLEKTL